MVAVLGARTENHLWLDAIRWLRFGFAHYESLLEKPMVADINSNVRVRLHEPLPTFAGAKTLWRLGTDPTGKGVLHCQDC